MGLSSVTAKEGCGSICPNYSLSCCSGLDHPILFPWTQRRIPMTLRETSCTSLNTCTAVWNANLVHKCPTFRFVLSISAAQGSWSLESTEYIGLRTKQRTSWCSAADKEWDLSKCHLPAKRLIHQTSNLPSQWQSNIGVHMLNCRRR